MGEGATCYGGGFGLREDGRKLYSLQKPAKTMFVKEKGSTFSKILKKDILRLRSKWEGEAWGIGFNFDFHVKRSETHDALERYLST